MKKKLSVRNQPAVFLAVISLLAAVLGSCAPAAIPETGAAPVNIQMTDSEITAPAQVSSGIVTFNIENTGQAPRALILARLNTDVTFEQFMETFQQSDVEAVALVALKGGHSAPPGEPQQVTVDLDDGTYVALGFPESDAPPIFGTFQVGGGQSQATAPTASVMVNLSDFTFDLPNEISAGEQTWELRNTGDQWHEMVLFKLEEGMTEDELVEMLSSEQEPQGPPPFEEAGFFGPASNGERFWVEVNLEPGTYTAVCFLPNVLDPASGQNHLQEGMVKTFEVTAP